MTVGPSAWWYLTRSSGAVALILLTVGLLIGVASIGRLGGPGVPRFMVGAVHRSASLLALVFLSVHILTAVLDSYASISPVNAVLPFTGSYRPLWLGLGALAFDLLLAVAVTSLLRRHLGHRAWKAVHWLGYLAWPIALLHALGTGSDARQTWMLAIGVACAAAVLAAAVARALIGWPDRAGLRIALLTAAGAFALGLVVWLPAGPLARGWARRAGTPAALLGSSGGGRA
ncbi:MAG TPA: ferric reductase-like transmembrane domain-containing protein [Solirubrobacteraceae bacterium]|nr:ferric reductase-like transmembrane domain-containing protein [Solirubrobacteraceae bacterium]